MIGSEYLFLFGLAFVWITFATIQDLRKREVANWLNFSLIAFALAYRAFYSLSVGSLHFFLFGLIGFGLFVALAYCLYYGGVFAGGDAKLLMGLGAVLPFENYMDFGTLTSGFLFLLFFLGAVYTLVYSGFIAAFNRKKFSVKFSEFFVKDSIFFLAAFCLSLVFIFFSLSSWLWSLLFFSSFVLLYIYVSAVDACMVKIYFPKDLREGDWLVSNVKLAKGKVKKNVHGLSWQDIVRIRKEGKRVAIKEGIPFVPAFLFAFGIMVYVLAVLGLQISDLLALFLQRLAF